MSSWTTVLEIAKAPMNQTIESGAPLMARAPATAFFPAVAARRAIMPPTPRDAPPTSGARRFRLVKPSATPSPSQWVATCSGSLSATTTKNDTIATIEMSGNTIVARA